MALISPKLKAAVPWWAKIGAKMALSRLPVSGRAWQRLGLFSPGRMRDPDYALGIFDLHFGFAGGPPVGFSFLELGPGDSLSSAVIGYALGASRCWLIDSGAYATRDMDDYRRLAERLEGVEGTQRRFEIGPTDDLDAILSRCNATFLEGGLHSFSDVPDGCCDFVFSHSVLEHVPRADFAPLMGEIYRVLKPGGVSSHDVDFRDHLGGSLNHLRFSHRLWEAPWFARRSGFYTNRLLFSQMLGILRDAGFEAEIRNIDKWPKPPLPRTALDPAFRSLEDNDLRTLHCFVILTKPTKS